MDQHTIYTTHVPHAKKKLAARTFMLACAAGWVMLAIFASNLFNAGRKPPLNADSEKINPNTAPAGSLVRLPGIGPAKALDIIHYRDTIQGDWPAFVVCEDMENISGIGPKTVAKLKPYLIFENEEQQ